MTTSCLAELRNPYLVQSQRSETKLKTQNLNNSKENSIDVIKFYIAKTFHIKILHINNAVLQVKITATGYRDAKSSLGLSVRRNQCNLISWKKIVFHLKVSQSSANIRKQLKMLCGNYFCSLNQLYLFYRDQHV